ncbi:unnamed protein product, partial [Mesorhabditis belari]|uniref:Protein kinase domain-containing protein n=1 Tax=Mesorhabditis belari TaxID=2138241 RepID=A0AAF3ENQ9_9BILA
MGAVYELIGHEPPAAIKYMLCGNDAQLKIFKNECEALKNIYHKGPLKGVILDSTITYSMNTVLTWGIQLFDAIDHMYQKHKLVHRDIKPDNIFVTNEYQLKIGDFGAVKVVGDGTVTGTFIGTQRYMSPPDMKEDGVQRDLYEQVMKADVFDSHRNDVYSLGLVMWEIIERRTIFKKYEISGVFDRDLFLVDIIPRRLTEIESPECQTEIQKIISSCTNFQRIRRPAASGVLDFLKQTQQANEFISSLPFMPTEDKNQKELMKPIGFDGRTEWVRLKPYLEKATTSRETTTTSVERHIGNGAMRFVQARTLFVKPITKDGKQDFEEVMGDIELPEEYKPDTKDRIYRPPKLNEDKHVYHVIASGNFADIIAAVNRDGKPVAAKRYKIEELKQTSDGYTRLRREIQISRFNRHENIVEFYDDFVEKPENPTHIWLVTERMDHTLEKYFEHLRRKDETPEPVKRELRQVGALLTQLLRALDYIHQRGIMHRDVTPRNIGMNQKEFEIKLLDFGLARETNPKLDHLTNVDTFYIYRSLEVFMRTKYNTGVDIWAAALVALEMLGIKLFMPTEDDEEITKKNGKPGMENAVKDRIFTVLGVPEDQYQSIFGRPIEEKPHAGELDKIWEEKIEPRLDRDIGPLRRDDFKDLIKKMLHPNQQQRLRADECLLHPFLRILNEKYDQRASSLGTGKQPKDDQQMKSRNAQNREVLLKEMADPRNQRLFTDEKFFN